MVVIDDSGFIFVVAFFTATWAWFYCFEMKFRNVCETKNVIHCYDCMSYVITLYLHVPVNLFRTICMISPLCCANMSLHWDILQVKWDLCITKLVSSQFVPMPTRTQVNSYPLPTRTYATSYPIPSRTQVISYPIPTRTYPSHLVPTTISYPTNNLKDFWINFGTYYTHNYVTYQLSVLCILRERLSVKLFFCDRQRILSKTVSRHHTNDK